MTPEPAGPDPSGGFASLGRDVTEDLLFHGFQARFLETGVRELVRSGLLGSGFARFNVDVRAMVIARAMRPAPGGEGDICHPGPLSPGPALAFGATPLEFLRHVASRGTSPAAARAGGRSWTDPRRGLVGWGGARGTMTQVLAGAALAFKHRGEDRAALVFEERDAVDTGGWHEGMNLAGTLGAPLIVVLAGRGPAGTEQSPDLRAVGTSYGVSVATVAGEPHYRLFHAVATARRRAAEGGGPTLIELLPGAEADRWALHDAFVARTLAEGGLAAGDLGAIERAAAAGVEHAVERLTKEPGPDPHDALAPVWTGAGPLEPWTRGEHPGPDPRASAGTPGDPHVN